MSKSKSINVQGQDISITQINNQDFICLTNMVKIEEGSDHIRNWMRNRNTVEYLGLWETLNNPEFKGVDFDTLRAQAGLNSFNLTPRKWIDTTKAKGIISISGKNGGTYAHKDIAFEFASWLSPIFKLYLIKEFQRLKDAESNVTNIEWNVRRVLSKAHYHVQTQAVKEYRIPKEGIPKDKEGFIYAEEADILNYAVFGFSAKQWREANPELHLKGLNVRDFASINELAILSIIEGMNAEMIKYGQDKKFRLYKLKDIAKRQIEALNRVDFDKSFKKVMDNNAHLQNTNDEVFNAEETNLNMSFGDALRIIGKAGKPKE